MNIDHLLHYLLYMNIGTPAYDYTNERVFAMKSGSQLPFCNRVCGAKDTNIHDIIKIKMFYHGTPFRWFVNQDDGLLKKQLESFGLQYKISYPAMSIRLEDVKPQEYSPDMQVKKIDNAEYELWSSIVARAYNIPAVNQFKIFVEYLLKRAMPHQIHLYIAYYKNTAAAASMVIDHPDMVGLHWVGTLPEYRNNGLGLAVSHKPLLDARERNSKKAILLASEIGESIYNKIGFKKYADYDAYGH